MLRFDERGGYALILQVQDAMTGLCRSIYRRPFGHLIEIAKVKFILEKVLILKPAVERCDLLRSSERHRRLVIILTKYRLVLSQFARGNVVSQRALRLRVLNIRFELLVDQDLGSVEL